MREKRARLDARDRLADVGVKVGEGAEGELGTRPCFGLDLAREIVVGERLHAASAVMDEHDLGGLEQPLGDDQRADHVVGDHATGVADDVRVSRFQPKRREDVQPGVHAGDDRDAGAGASRTTGIGNPFSIGQPFGIGQQRVNRVHLVPPTSGNDNRNLVRAGQLVG
jgi:hypothetical protein